MVVKTRLFFWHIRGIITVCNFFAVCLYNSSFKSFKSFLVLVEVWLFCNRHQLRSKIPQPTLNDIVLFIILLILISDLIQSVQLTHLLLPLLLLALFLVEWLILTPEVFVVSCVLHQEFVDPMSILHYLGVLFRYLIRTFATVDFNGITLVCSIWIDRFAFLFFQLPVEFLHLLLTGILWFSDQIEIFK